MRLKTKGAVIFGLLAAGCATKITYLPPGTTFGEITISKPRVSTRERLINDRLTEETWLEEQLRATDSKTFGVQGHSDIRSFTGMFVRAGAQADSGAISLYRESQSQDLEDLKRQRALKDLDYQIALAKKQKEVADAVSSPASASSSYYPGAPISAKAASAPSVDPSQQISALSTKLNDLASSINAMTGRSGNTGKPETTVAVASPIDEFRDKLAYRDEILGRKIWNAWDDAHDLHGNALYRLSFDINVMPGSDTSAWAIVGVEVKLPEGDSLIGPEKFARVVASRVAEHGRDYANLILNACPTTGDLPGCLLEMRAEALSRLTAMAKVPAVNLKPDETLKPSAWLRLQELAPQTAGAGAKSVASRKDASDLTKLLHIRSGLSGQPSRESIALGALEAVQTALLRQLTADKSSDVRAETMTLPGGSASEVKCIPNAKKRLQGFNFDDVNNVLYVSDPEVAKVTIRREQMGSDSISVRDAWKQDQGDLRLCQVDFRKRLQEVDKRTARPPVSAYGATPTESVQRVSEVLSRREASEFALALQTVTGAASLNAMLDYMRVNDALFHALRRQPLVVGYSGGFKGVSQTEATASFGWVIGPRYEIRNEGRNQSAGFRHVPVQNSVAALISVPPDVDHVILKIRKCWKPENENWDGDTEGKQCKDGQDIKVSLPGTEQRAFQLLGDDRFGPSISPVENQHRYRVSAGDNATLLIRGEQLWRNTMVLLGGQRADRVTVLPDMRGILASFDRIAQPGQSGTSGNELELRVITSEGSRSVAMVNVDSGQKDGRAVKWGTDTLSKAVYPEGTLDVRGIPGVPAAFYELRLRLFNQTAQKPATETVDSDILEGSLVRFKLPTKDKFPGWADGQRIGVDVIFKRSPNDPQPQSGVVDSLVYYSSKEAADATYKITRQLDPSHDADLTLPIQYAQAFPELSAVKPLAVSFEFTNKDDDPAPTRVSASCALEGKDARLCRLRNIAIPKGRTFTVTLGDEGRVPTVRRVQ